MNFENLRKSHKKTSIDNNYNCFKLKNEKLLIKSNWLVIQGFYYIYVQQFIFCK